MDTANKLMLQIDKERNERFHHSHHNPNTLDGMRVEEIYAHLSNTAKEAIKIQVTGLINRIAQTMHWKAALVKLPKTIADNYILGSQVMLDAVIENYFENNGHRAYILLQFEREFMQGIPALDYVSVIRTLSDTPTYCWGELVWLYIVADTLGIVDEGFKENLTVAVKNANLHEIKTMDVLQLPRWRVLDESAEAQYKALMGII